MRSNLLLAALLLLCGLPSGAAIADASGVAKGVDPAANATRDNAVRTLVVGSDIFIGDRVVTGDKGQVQIKFADQTELVVGPHSSLLIDDYLLRDDGSNGNMVVDMLAGSFRFVTGRAAKNRYLIKTPTGTIGVRGTGFDTFVDRSSKRSRVLLYHGVVDLCNLAGKCVTLRKTCELGEVTEIDATLLGNTDDIIGDDREQLRDEFIYSESEAPLLREFRVEQAFRCLHRNAGGSPQDPEHNQNGEPAAPTGGGTGGGVILLNTF